MVDIVDIRSAVKNGDIRFVVNEAKSKIFCEGVHSGERVCVNDSLELPEDTKTWKIYQKDIIRFVIVMNKDGKEVYFKYICAGNQGKFDGEILFTSNLNDAAKYTTLSMVEAQIKSVEFSLKKNPDLSNPRIETIVLS